MNHELLDVQTGFRKERGTKDQIAKICWIIKKAREFQKNIYFCFIYHAKAFVWITTNWKILREIEIPDHLTCHLRNWYAGQEATVRTGYRRMDWFKTGKGVRQGRILSLFQFSSVAQSGLTLCDSINRSMPGLPVHHQLPEFTQTHVHRVGDAIHPSHPLSSPFPPDTG